VEEKKEELANEPISEEDDDGMGLDEDLELLCDQALAEKFKEDRKDELSQMKKDIDSKIASL
jgi:hypothetical protein